MRLFACLHIIAETPWQRCISLHVLAYTHDMCTCAHMYYHGPPEKQCSNIVSEAPCSSRSVFDSVHVCNVSLQPNLQVYQRTASNL